MALKNPDSFNNQIQITLLHQLERELSENRSSHSINYRFTAVVKMCLKYFCKFFLEIFGNKRNLPKQCKFNGF